MKKFVTTAILAVLLGSGSALNAQDRQEDYLGLPGDNLNLYAVMKLFQESKTLEEFERDLNDEKSNINNLDLNNDSRVDYIKVMDNIDDNVHNIVMQVAVGPKENQDVAVFTVQRFNNGEVQIQLIGDEELYGRDYIIEPRIDDSMAETPNPGYTGRDRVEVTYYRTTPVEIAAWPIVRFVYLPSYTRWHSSWNWGYYPSYWHPWRPFSYHYYYGYHYHWYNDYYAHYRPWKHHRYTRWNDYYYSSRRSHSPEVSRRIQTGVYKTTYSRPADIRKGEARFVKSNPDVVRKSTSRSSSNGINYERRSSTTVTNRFGSSPTNDRNTNTTTRRSSTTVTKRSESPSNRSVSTPSNRSVSTPSNRSVTDSPKPSNNSKVSNRRSSTKSESAPTVRSSNPEKQSRTNSSSSASKRKAEKKSESSKSSESKKKTESTQRRR